jgi:hypothetical protein
MRTAEEQHEQQSSEKPRARATTGLHMIENEVRSTSTQFPTAANLELHDFAQRCSYDRPQPNRFWRFIANRPQWEARPANRFRLCRTAWHKQMLTLLSESECLNIDPVFGLSGQELARYHAGLGSGRGRSQRSDAAQGRKATSWRDDGRQRGSIPGPIRTRSAQYSASGALASGNAGRAQHERGTSTGLGRIFPVADPRREHPPPAGPLALAIRANTTLGIGTATMTASSILRLQFAARRHGWTGAPCGA